MEDLIRGVADVALGGLRRDGDEDLSQRNVGEERARSTWAQVVAEGQDEVDQELDWRRHGYYRNQGRSDVLSERQDGDDRGSNQRPDDGYGWNQWKSDQGHESYRRDEGTELGSYGEDMREGKEQDEDGWQTVGRKHARHKVHKDQWNQYKRPPSEQEYSAEVPYSNNLEPSEQELSDLSEACNKLWELDYNRLVPDKDYQIDCGEGKKTYQTGDMAQGNLFSWLSEDIFRRPTYARFCSLLDNYNPKQGCKEVVTTEEKQEQAAFIEEICRTAPIKYLYRYLSRKGIIPESYQEFKSILTSLWFDVYGRGGSHGTSSAFEHVFVGEIKQQGEEEVSGFHNWLQFYLEEAKGNVDYQGYIFPRRRGETPDSETRLLTIQFEWNGVLKSLSSTFIGVSPEFEVALYTLCFFVGEEENHIQLGPYPVNIKCYRFGKRIGSAFPVAVS